MTAAMLRPVPTPRRPIPPALRRVPAAIPRPEPRRVMVTPSEHRVLLELIRDGAPDAVIAGRLHRSTETVKTHVKALLRKTGCSGRTALVVAVLRRRIAVVSPAVPAGPRP